MDGQAVAAGIEADGDPVAVSTGPGFEGGGGGDGGGADHHPSDAHVERGFDVGDLAGAPTGLDWDRDRPNDLGDDVEVAPSSAPGAVEVDDVQPLGALGLEAAGQRHWILTEPSDPIEVALSQPDRPAVEQVDGGQHYHRVSMLAW